MLFRVIVLCKACSVYITIIIRFYWGGGGGDTLQYIVYINKLVCAERFNIAFRVQKANGFHPFHVAVYFSEHSWLVV